MLPSDYACPRCKCRACYALHRKGIDWVVSLLGLRPARCLTCNRRFYARYSITQNGLDVLKGARKDAVRGNEAHPVDSERSENTFNNAA